MKKKLFILGTLVISVYAMTACGGKQETPAPTPEAVQEAVEEAEAVQETVEETVQEAAEATEPETLLEDFVGEMDLSGSWDDEVSKRASMEAIWEIHGEYDPVSGMLSYDDGNYSIHTFDDKGNETISGEEKTSGAFMKEGDKLRWQDSKNADMGLFSKTAE